MLLLEGHTSPVYALAFSPDGRCLASGTRDGAVWLWGGEQECDQFQIGGRLPEDPINSIEYHPDGKGLAIACRSGYVVRRDSATEEVSLFIPSRRASATAARFVTPGLLAIGFGERGKPEPGSLELWEYESEQRREPYFATAQGTRAVAVYSPAKLVAWAEWGRRLTVWDITSPNQHRFHLAHNCTSLAFHPDGDQIAAGIEWGAKTFDVTRRQERLSLAGHKGQVSQVAFSPDGRSLATGSWDGTVRVWDARSGGERACFRWPIGKVFALAYSPDGLRLAAAGEKGVIVIWDAD